VPTRVFLDTVQALCETVEHHTASSEHCDMVPYDMNDVQQVGFLCTYHMRAWLAPVSSIWTAPTDICNAMQLPHKRRMWIDSLKERPPPEPPKTVFARILSDGLNLDDLVAKQQEYERQVAACAHSFKPARRDIDLGAECEHCKVRELPWLKRRVADLERALAERQKLGETP